MLAPFVIVVSIIVISIVYEIINDQINHKRSFDKTDAVILCIVFVAFLSEIVFYYIVIDRYRYVSDNDILRYFINRPEICSRLTEISDKLAGN
jgi:hypothetical protein